MPTIIPQYYYLDSPSFNTATSIYVDAGLTVCAPDGMYSNGLITRELVDCVLLPKQTCYSCGSICGDTLTSGLDMGVYDFDANLGSNSTSVGAVVIRFDPEVYPDGILVTYDGTAYNKLYSPTYGLLQSTTPGTATYVGVGAYACSIVLVGGTGTFDEYDYDGASFYLTGNTQSVTVLSGQLKDTPTAPGACVMVIPKPNPTPSAMNVKIYSLCGDNDGWTIQIECPQLLPEFLRSEIQGEVFNCSSPINLSFYRVPINLPASSTLQIGDLVFEDEYGTTALPDGFYLVNSSILPPTNNTIEVQNGAIKGFSLNCEA